jgi:putative transposase
MAHARCWRMVQAEAAAWLSAHADKLTDDGRQRLVRHGYLPEREIMTGIGAVRVRCPRVRDRVGEGGERIRFSSAILPPYARRSKSLEVLLPILYLKGVSTGDFEDALIALLGKDAGGLSAATIGRLKQVWSEEHLGVPTVRCRPPRLTARYRETDCMAGHVGLELRNPCPSHVFEIS